MNLPAEFAAVLGGECTAGRFDFYVYFPDVKRASNWWGSTCSPCVRLCDTLVQCAINLSVRKEFGGGREFPSTVLRARNQGEDDEWSGFSSRFPLGGLQTIGV